MTSRTLPLLEPYLALPPEAAQIVISGVLGASTNWLVLRYLHSLLLRPPAAQRASRSGDTGPPSGDGTAGTAAAHTPAANVHVLLVSFLRDFTFWKDAAGRLGVDLEALGRAGQFAFVDGLSSLFVPDHGAGRSTPAPATATARQPPPASIPGPPAASGLPSWRRALGSTKVSDVSAVLAAAVEGLRDRRAGEDSGSLEAGENKKVVLVMDQLDFLLAATGPEVTGLDLREMLQEMRETVDASILTLAADEPLISAQTTMLEKEHASFALSLAHEAEMVLSLRLLDTGTARDVSGLIRITRGGEDSGRRIEEREYLYHVGGDGGVSVFERGQ